jgi:FkbM family methyltransferase
VKWQEDGISWADLPHMAKDEGVDVVLWTRTWNMPSKGTPFQVQLDALDGLHSSGIPTVGYHLDRWWGLDREHQIHDEPFFKCSVLATADGGHDEQWAEAGIRHWWFPPGVLGSEARRQGRWREDLAVDVAFVGSWQQYHHEWPHRMQLISWLRAQFERHGRLRLYGAPGQAVRGQLLADVYASAKVVVGDSCLAGDITKYYSDRVPETLGRGGFLLHPWVVGLDEQYRPDGHLVTWEAGDFPTLRRLIDHYCAEDEERERIAAAGRAHVLTHHTYEHRMQTLFDRLHTEGILAPPDGATGRRRYWDSSGRSAVADLRVGSDDALVWNEVWRLPTYDLTDDAVRGRPVIDLGANVGAFSVWAALAGASDVIAVEPVEANRVALEGNLAANLVADRVTVLDGAAWTESGWLTATVVEAGASSYVRETATEGTVRTWSLDDLLLATSAERSWTRAVVKLDIEGAEGRVIAGLTRWDLVERIVMEFHGAGINPAAGQALDLTVERFGQMVATMASHGRVEVNGRPEVGGLLTWRRYE